MTTSTWVIVGVALLITIVLAIFVAIVASKTVTWYVALILATPKWLVVTGFLIFPPAFVLFLVGLFPYSYYLNKADKEFYDDLNEYMWERFPPPDHIKGDEETRRKITTERRKLGYYD